MLYRSRIKNWEFDKETFKISCSERATIAKGGKAKGENKNFEDQSSAVKNQFLKYERYKIAIMGDAQDVGISFLETALKATEIIIAGHSLGGAATHQAILQHEFKEDKTYTVVSQMTFDRASNICGKIIGKQSPHLEWIVSKLVHFAGLEMDSVEASKKLERLKIREIIVQCTNKKVPANQTPKPGDFSTDGVIMPQASLGHALVKEGIIGNKTFICLPNEGHNTEKAFYEPLCYMAN